jgi:diguanylate cyclase (GGDEF)-like protein
MAAPAPTAAHSSERTKIPTMSGALFALVAIMAALGAVTFWLDSRTQSVADRHRQLAANIERIRYYDEALTMSARYAAASGDLSYRARYDVFAPQLEVLIGDTIALAANPLAEARIRSTDAANFRLVDLETQAFELTETGRGTAALAILNGPEYAAEKQDYSLGLEGAIAEIDSAARVEDEQGATIRLLVPLMVLLGGVVIAGVWLRYRRSTATLLSNANLSAHRGAVLARLSDRLTFAVEEEDLLEAAVGALSKLVPTSGGDVLVLNASQDRLTVGVSWGPDARTPGQPVQLDRPNRCPALRRGAAYLSEDLSDPLAVTCPAHPIEHGSVLCIPLLALGQMIGVLHLASDAGGFTVDDQGQASRLAEQVALALANARLLRTMESLAMADPLTGLYNMRFFDPLLERELTVSAREARPVGLIMLDIDHFKPFNDTHGHPAGDAALRAFGALLRSTVREADTVARYGGEEFVVLLRGADLVEAGAVAEKLRAAVEEMVVELGPGRFGRVTASFGVASTNVHGHDRTNLVAVADRALYQAKELGRNRIVIAGRPDDPGQTTSPLGSAPTPIRRPPATPSAARRKRDRTVPLIAVAAAPAVRER